MAYQESVTFNLFASKQRKESRIKKKKSPVIVACSELCLPSWCKDTWLQEHKNVLFSLEKVPKELSGYLAVL